MGKAMKAKSETVWIGCWNAGPNKGRLAVVTCRRTKYQCKVAYNNAITRRRLTVTQYRLTQLKPRGKRRGKK